MTDDRRWNNKCFNSARKPTLIHCIEVDLDINGCGYSKLADGAVTGSAVAVTYTPGEYSNELFLNGALDSHVSVDLL